MAALPLEEWLELRPGAKILIRRGWSQTFDSSFKFSFSSFKEGTALN